MKERIVSLDIAKAICIVLVVIGHYAPENAPHWYVVLHDVIYSFHMPLFMFASGYIYIATRKDIGYGSFMQKKIKRLFVPYLATSAIVITLKLLMESHAYVENPVTVLSYVRMFYLPEAGYFLWFVWALMWMFVIVPLFRTRESRLALLVVALALHFLPIPFTKVFCLSEFKAMLVYFMAGVTVFEYRTPRQFVMTLNKFQAVCITLLFAAMEALRSGKIAGGGETYYIYAINVTIPFVGILFIMELSKLVEMIKEEKLMRTLLLISASSYTIYLFHTTFMGFAKALCVRLPFDSDLWYIFVPEAVAVTCAGVAIPMMLHYWVLKRYALTRTLFGL